MTDEEKTPSRNAEVAASLKYLRINESNPLQLLSIKVLEDEISHLKAEAERMGREIDKVVEELLWYTENAPEELILARVRAEGKDPEVDAERVRQAMLDVVRQRERAEAGKEGE